MRLSILFQRLFVLAKKRKKTVRDLSLYWHSKIYSSIKSEGLMCAIMLLVTLVHNNIAGKDETLLLNFKAE